MFGARLLGYTISNRGPVQHLHLERSDGLSVLYGLNGAGKSSILAAIEAGLQGWRGGATVHIAVDAPYAPTEATPFDMAYSLLSAGCAAIDEAPRELGRTAPWDPYEWRVDAELRERYGVLGDYFLEQLQLGEAVQAIVDWELSEEPSPDEDRLALAAEIAQAGLFTLTPIGALAAPRWRVDVAVRVGDGFPLIDRMINAIWSDRDRTPPRDVDEMMSALGDETAAGREFVLNGHDEDVRAQIERPAWAPYQIVYFGEIEAECPMPVPLSDRSGMALDRDLFDHLVQSDPSGLLDAAVEDEISLRPGAQERLDELHRRVNQTMAKLLVDPPVIRLEVVHPNEVYAGASPFRWTASDRASLQEVPFDALSDFQRRWATFAVRLEMSRFDMSAVLLVDEPERTAHPRALNYLARGLTELASEFADIVVASHSPLLLDQPTAHLLHVARGATGRTAIAALKPEAWHRLELAQERLGMTPSDVMQLIRGFLVVEGEHDRAVIEPLIGEELDRIGVRLLVMRGTHNLLSLLDSQFLLDFTDAPVLVIVDRANGTRINKIRKKLAGMANGRELGSALRPLTDGTSEEQKIAELLSSAWKSGHLGRVQIFGLSEVDIMKYLPVERFVSGATSWREVDERWGHVGDFKQWLRSEGANVSPSSLRRIAGDMDSIPSEFTRLLAVAAESASCRPRGK